MSLIYDVRDFAPPDSSTVTDWAPIIMAACEASAGDPATAPPANLGGLVVIPPGTYPVRTCIKIGRGVRLRGVAGHGSAANTLLLAHVLDGDFLAGLTIAGEDVQAVLCLMGYLTGPMQTPPMGAADWGIVEGLAIHSTHPGGGTTFPAGPGGVDGVRVFAHGAKVRDLHVVGMPRHGVHVLGGQQYASNTNNTQFAHLLLTGNGGDGIKVGGDDGNACTAIDIDATGNWRSGIHDHGFLGNTWIGCHTSANRKYNYECVGSTRNSTFVGCYAEQDAPSYFSGPVVIEGGCIAGITPDSQFEGYAPASGGRRALTVSRRAGSPVRDYPGYGAGYGLYVDAGTVVSPGNGFSYVALSSGRTAGAPSYAPGEAAPVWPTTSGATVAELDGLVWQCVGPFVRDKAPFVHLGGSNGTELLSYGYSEDDGGTTNPYWIHALSQYAGTSGRILTGLQGGVQTFAQWQTGYKNGPAPGQVMHPAVWLGGYDFGERRIEVQNYQTPSQYPPGSGFRFFSPGDLVLNGRMGGPRANREGPCAWVVREPCGIAGYDWAPNAHFRLGDTVRPSTANGHVYRAYAYTAGSPKAGLSCVTGAVEPTWPTVPWYTVDDGHITWICLTDLAADSSPLEAIPVQAAAHADSAATDVAGVVSDLNALLAKLRSAGVIAS